VFTESSWTGGYASQLPLSEVEIVLSMVKVKKSRESDCCSLLREREVESMRGKRRAVVEKKEVADKTDHPSSSSFVRVVHLHFSPLSA